MCDTQCQVVSSIGPSAKTSRKQQEKTQEGQQEMIPQTSIQTQPNKVFMATNLARKVTIKTKRENNEKNGENEKPTTSGTATNKNTIDTKTELRKEQTEIKKENIRNHESEITTKHTVKQTNAEVIVKQSKVLQPTTENTPNVQSICNFNSTAQSTNPTNNDTLSPPLSESPSSASSITSTLSSLNTPCTTLLNAVGNNTNVCNSASVLATGISGNDLATHFVFARNILEASCAGVLESIETKNERRNSTYSTANSNRNSTYSTVQSTDLQRLRMEGLKWMKKLANGTATRPSYGDACAYLGDLYSNGTLGLILDTARAFSYWTLGAKQSHPYCSFRVARAYDQGIGTKRDSAKALQFYRKAAALGDASGMHRLGIILLYGQLGATRSDREAVSWMKRAIGTHPTVTESPIDQSVVNPMNSSYSVANSLRGEVLFELAVLYENGTSSAVIKDERYALALYQQAATLGHTHAQHRLGVAWSDGDLGIKDPDPLLSVHYHRMAAEGGGLADAQLALSAWCLAGVDGPGGLVQSEVDAYAWARKAADQGHCKAEYAVGYYSEAGIGTQADVGEAMRWYQRAAEHGNSRAKIRVQEMRTRRKKSDGCSII